MAPLSLLLGLLCAARILATDEYPSCAPVATFPSQALGVSAPPPPPQQPPPASVEVTSTALWVVERGGERATQLCLGAPPSVGGGGGGAAGGATVLVTAHGAALGLDARNATQYTWCALLALWGAGASARANVSITYASRCWAASGGGNNGLAATRIDGVGWRPRAADTPPAGCPLAAVPAALQGYAVRLMGGGGGGGGGAPTNVTTAMSSSGLATCASADVCVLDCIVSASWLPGAENASALVQYGAPGRATARCDILSLSLRAGAGGSGWALSEAHAAATPAPSPGAPPPSANASCPASAAAAASTEAHPSWQPRFALSLPSPTPSGSPGAVTAATPTCLGPAAPIPAVMLGGASLSPEAAPGQVSAFQLDAAGLTIGLSRGLGAPWDFSTLCISGWEVLANNTNRTVVRLWGGRGANSVEHCIIARSILIPANGTRRMSFNVTAPGIGPSAPPPPGGYDCQPFDSGGAMDTNFPTWAPDAPPLRAAPAGVPPHLWGFGSPGNASSGSGATVFITEAAVGTVRNGGYRLDFQQVQAVATLPLELVFNGTGAVLAYALALGARGGAPPLDASGVPAASYACVTAYRYAGAPLPGDFSAGSAGSLALLRAAAPPASGVPVPCPRALTLAPDGSGGVLYPRWNALPWVPTPSPSGATPSAPASAAPSAGATLSASASASAVGGVTGSASGTPASSAAASGAATGSASVTAAGTASGAATGAASVTAAASSAASGSAAASPAASAGSSPAATASLPGAASASGSATGSAAPSTSSASAPPSASGTFAAASPTVTAAAAASSSATAMAAASLSASASAAASLPASASAAASVTPSASAEASASLAPLSQTPSAASASTTPSVGAAEVAANAAAAAAAAAPAPPGVVTGGVLGTAACVCIALVGAMYVRRRARSAIVSSSANQSERRAAAAAGKPPPSPHGSNGSAFAQGVSMRNPATAELLRSSSLGGGGSVRGMPAAGGQHAPSLAGYGRAGSAHSLVKNTLQHAGTSARSRAP